MKQSLLNQELLALVGWALEADLACKTTSSYNCASGRRRPTLASSITAPALWHAKAGSAGVPQLWIHDLRHSVASVLVDAGRSLYEAQELPGHSGIRTTSRYAHLSQERLREAVEPWSRCQSPHEDLMPNRPVALVQKALIAMYSIAI